jgi:hypothetical protein
VRSCRAAIALIVRIPFIRTLAISTDFLYETVDVAICSVLEPPLGIMAGCIATLKPLFSSLGFGGSGSGTASRRYGAWSPKYMDGGTDGTASTGGGGVVGGWRAGRMQRLSDGLYSKGRGGGGGSGGGGDGDESPIMFSKSGDDLGVDIELAKPRRTAPGAGSMPLPAHVGAGVVGGVQADAYGPSSPPRNNVGVSAWDGSSPSSNNNSNNNNNNDHRHNNVGTWDAAKPALGWPLARPVVHVETSVDVTMTAQQQRNQQHLQRPGTDSSSEERIFPLQGALVSHRGIRSSR